jgi:phosphoribosylamine--glycine ligase
VRVLVLGSGGREHAIVHALRRSPEVKEVFAAPGNPGIAQAADLLPLAADDLPALAEAASDLRIDLTVVGPEVPLALGIADEFARRGLRLFGPKRAAAEIESSKIFAKEFCIRHSIPTARARSAQTEEAARQALAAIGLPAVLKADGLAAGKGVLIVTSDEEVDQAMETFFDSRSFGEAGDRVLVEEFLTGVEISFMVITDGRSVVPVATSHDYKRVGDGDSGPNTGGMGSHSPALIMEVSTVRTVLDTIVMPTIRGLAEEAREYRGLLYVGLMLTDDGPKVLEYNCRFGDPETQSILLRLDDSLAAVARSATDGRLHTSTLKWRREAVACVVAAAEGYPSRPRLGQEITGIDAAMELPGVTVYQAGTRLTNGRLVSSGGRVLSVCGRGATLEDAVATAYRGMEEIHFDGMVFRRDIGADTLEILQSTGGRDESS